MSSSPKNKKGKYTTNENKTIKIPIVVQTCCTIVVREIKNYIATLLMKLNYTSYSRHESAQPT